MLQRPVPSPSMGEGQDGGEGYPASPNTSPSADA